MNDVIYELENNSLVNGSGPKGFMIGVPGNPRPNGSFEPSRMIPPGETITSIVRGGLSDKLLQMVSDGDLIATRVSFGEDGAAVVAVSGGKTTSKEENKAGLASAILLANGIKSTYNAHVADFGGSGEEHLLTDTAAALDDADSIASLVALTSELQDLYVAHNAESILGSPTIHQAQGTDRALASATNPTDLEESITVLLDLKAKYNLHDADAVSHSTGGTHQEAVADAAYGATIVVAEANVLAGDLVQWGILNDGTGNVTGVGATAVDGGIEFEFSADPVADTIISYSASRA